MKSSVLEAEKYCISFHMASRVHKHPYCQSVLWDIFRLMFALGNILSVLNEVALVHHLPLVSFKGTYNLDTLHPWC